MKDRLGIMWGILQVVVGFGVCFSKPWSIVVSSFYILHLFPPASFPKSTHKLQFLQVFMNLI